MAAAGSRLVSRPEHGATDHVPSSAGSTPPPRGVNAAQSSPSVATGACGALASAAAPKPSAAAIASRGTHKGSLELTLGRKGHGLDLPPPGDRPPPGDTGTHKGSFQLTLGRKGHALDPPPPGDPM